MQSNQTKILTKLKYPRITMILGYFYYLTGFDRANL